MSADRKSGHRRRCYKVFFEIRVQFETSLASGLSEAVLRPTGSPMNATPRIAPQHIERETEAPMKVGIVVPDVGPSWNAQRRELRLNGKLVKRFRQPAVNQALILSAFEEEGWPESISDPLPGSPGVDPAARLHNAIQRLNAAQQEGRIIFERDGTGEGILWRAL